MNPRADMSRIVKHLEYSERVEAADALEQFCLWMARHGQMDADQWADLEFILSSFADYLRK